MEAASAASTTRWYFQIDFSAHAAAFFCHASAGGGSRFASRAIHVGACRHRDDSNLYACGRQPVTACPSPILSATARSTTARCGNSYEAPIVKNQYSVRLNQRYVNPLTRNHGLDTLRIGCQENRADSSVGRALPLQGRGHRFNPCSAYHAGVVVRRDRMCACCTEDLSLAQEFIGDHRFRLVVLLSCHR